MLRTKRAVRALTTADRDQALEVCARDTRTNVFVAARILEGGLATSPGAVLGYNEGSGMQAICWVSANLVPVGCDRPALAAFATTMRRRRHHCSSVLGPSEMVLPLWEALRQSWGEPRAVRAHQQVLATAGPLPSGMSRDPQVRLARFDEVDLVMPAAAAMAGTASPWPRQRGATQTPWT